MVLELRFQIADEVARFVDWQIFARDQYRGLVGAGIDRSQVVPQD